MILLVGYFQTMCEVVALINLGLSPLQDWEISFSQVMGTAKKKRRENEVEHILLLASTTYVDFAAISGKSA